MTHVQSEQQKHQNNVGDVFEHISHLFLVFLLLNLNK